VIAGPYASVPILLDPALEDLGDRLVGMVTTSFVPLDRSRPAWNEYVNEFDTAFPELASTASSAYHLLDIDFNNAMEAILQALEAVNGNLSGRAERFHEALASVRLEAPNGRIYLDQANQAIVPIYLSRVVRSDNGKLVYETFRMIPGVDQTFGGLLPIDGPSPNRLQPPCRKAAPPPWAAAS
jgi:hypothetical protein